MFRVTADPHRFTEAVNWFRARLPITESELASLSEKARGRAWTIAGVTQLDIVKSVFDEIDKANTDGTPFEAFKKAVEDKLTAEWGRRDSARIETIFRNATQSALNRGRYAQMTHPDVVRFRPFWMFDAIDDSRTTQLCHSLDNTVLPQEHPFWLTHIPPLHHRCRSGIRSLRRAEAEKRGIATEAPDTEAEAGFGKAPDKSEWKPIKTKYPPEILQAGKKRAARRSKPDPVLTEGVHIKRVGLVKGISETTRSQVFEAARKARMIGYLEKSPLNEVFFGGSRVRRVNGAYWRYSAQLGLNTRRAFKTGDAFEPGKSWSVSMSGTDRVDAMRRTFVHELGHHLHFTSGQDVDTLIRLAFKDAESKKITRYAGSNYKEYFAESFAAYTFHRGELREFDPVGYRMVQNVLKEVGVPL